MFSLGGDVWSAELYVVMGRSPLCTDSVRDPWSSPTYLEDYQEEGEEAVVAYLHLHPHFQLHLHLHLHLHPHLHLHLCGCLLQRYFNLQIFRTVLNKINF